MNNYDTAKIKILVAGDIMLDSYVFGTVERVSPEAPISILLEKREAGRHVLGGAANVAVNVSVTGALVELLSVVGKDENGERLEAELERAGIHTGYIVRDAQRVTTVKLRYIGQNNQQLLRVDTEDTFDIRWKAVSEKLDILKKVIEEYQLLILSDYQKGFLTPEITQYLIHLANAHRIPVLVDVKDPKYSKYKGAFLLKPNRKELGMLTEMSVCRREDVIEASCYLCKAAECEYVLTTLGAEGMVLVDREGLICQGQSAAREVFDVTGAGDTFIAYLASELARGSRLTEAVKIAECAAGIQVSKSGTSVVYPEEVDTAMRRTILRHRNKWVDVYTWGDLKSQRYRGEKVVFTNGCFDILHAGHVTYLEQAAELGDILVVGINSDASVRRLKGDDRPVNKLEDRATVLASLECVDYIISFEEDTPLELIRKIEPDVLVKGGDYRPADIVGAEFVRERGGKVTTIPFLEGKATTDIIEKIREKVIR